MARINLHMALTLKNQIADEIRTKVETLRQFNVLEIDEAGRPLSDVGIDLTAMHAHLLRDSARMARLKSAITRANIDLYPLLAELEEKKALHNFYVSLETKAGRVRHFETHELKPRERIFKANIDAAEKLETVSRLKREMFELQSRIDDYNHRTTIETID